MSQAFVSPMCHYSDVIYCIAIFVQGYRMWRLVKSCAEIVKFLDALYANKNEKIY
jgi:hypothetical protein